MAASRASYFLSKNNDALQKSLDRLSSGKRITQPSDDAGGLAVAMKMQGSIDGLRGAANNVANALSFLQVQDGILDSAGKIVARMGELQSLSTDVLKNDGDIDNYETEFNDLRSQLYSLTKSQFNGVYLFGDWKDNSGTINGTDLDFANNDNTGRDHADASLDVVIDSAGSEVKIHKSLLGSALVINRTGTQAGGLNAAAAEATTAITGLVGRGVTDLTFQSTDDSHYLAAAFTTALENIATLRATNGGQASRLQYAQESIATQISNLEAAHGRIMDVDIAAETTNLAKQQILVQASASMVAQANSANQVALMLLQ